MSDVFDVGHVIALDVMNQPGRQHPVKLGTDVLAATETMGVGLNTVGEVLVDGAMRSQ